MRGGAQDGVVAAGDGCAGAVEAAPALDGGAFGEAAFEGFLFATRYRRSDSGRHPPLGDTIPRLQD